MPIDNTFIVSSFRTLGTATTAQNLFSIENQAGSLKDVHIRRANVVMDTTAVLTTVAVQLRSSRIATMPTGGTVLTKSAFDTGKPASIATVVCRGATASDGGAATAITATLGSILYEQLGQRMHTLVGQVLTDIVPVVPLAAADNPIVLKPGQALVVAVSATATGSNPATNHYVVNLTWDEVS
jgi:hypothetical protein